MKSFVREEVGLAIVPGITVRRELADGALVRVTLPELAMPRRTLMVYRDQGYLSESATELIKLVRSFNWEQEPVGKPEPQPPRAAAKPRGPDPRGGARGGEPMSNDQLTMTE